MVPADWQTTQNSTRGWTTQPSTVGSPLGDPGFFIFHSTAVSMTSQHQLAKIVSEVWVTRLPTLSHPPLSTRSPASHRKIRVSRWSVLTCDDQTLLYSKLSLSNTYSHAKNRNDPCPATWSTAALPEVGVSAVAILGGGWLQSSVSDGPPCRADSRFAPSQRRYFVTTSLTGWAQT